MNYAAHYARLIDRSRARSLSGYHEIHHVVPRCMGGGDEALNLVALTPEEHFLAHLLLVKIHKGHAGLIAAAVLMSGRGETLTGKRYGWLRRQYSALMKGSKRGPHSPEWSKKIGDANRGKPKSAAHRAALARAKFGTKRCPPSEATRTKMSESNKRSARTRDYSWMRTDEYRRTQAVKTAEAWKRRKAEGQRTI